VYNHIVPRVRARKIARPRARPVASGRVSLKLAWAWLVALCLVGLAVLVQLNMIAAIFALVSLAPVAAYPFMKRITWWPQAWLGIVFSWAALVGWPAAAGRIEPAMFWLYAGSIAWVIGYDTIYALQDMEDDALAGVKSSARALGEHARGGVAAFYGIALLLWGVALWHVRPEALALAALLPVACHLLWQVAGLKREDGGDALMRFRSNRFAGLLMFLACLVVGTAR
jgi:4-hydroxybenzoate polyprenyltransferase